jgi:hypothetical protein
LVGRRVDRQRFEIGDIDETMVLDVVTDAGKPMRCTMAGARISTAYERQ